MSVLAKAMTWGSRRYVVMAEHVGPRRNIQRTIEVIPGPTIPLAETDSAELATWLVQMMNGIIDGSPLLIPRPPGIIERRGRFEGIGTALWGWGYYGNGLVIYHGALSEQTGQLARQLNYLLQPQEQLDPS